MIVFFPSNLALHSSAPASTRRASLLLGATRVGPEAHEKKRPKLGSSVEFRRGRGGGGLRRRSSRGWRRGIRGWRRGCRRSSGLRRRAAAAEAGAAAAEAGAVAAVEAAGSGAGAAETGAAAAEAGAVAAVEAAGSGAAKGVITSQRRRLSHFARGMIQAPP